MAPTYMRKKREAAFAHVLFLGWHLEPGPPQPLSRPLPLATPMVFPNLPPRGSRILRYQYINHQPGLHSLSPWISDGDSAGLSLGWIVQGPSTWAQRRHL